MKNKLRVEKMNYLKNFSSYAVLCHLSLGLFVSPVFATINGVGAVSTGAEVAAPSQSSLSSSSTPVASGAPSLVSNSTASVGQVASTSISIGDQQFEQAQIAAQNLKALIAQQQSAASAGGMVNSTALSASSGAPAASTVSSTVVGTNLSGSDTSISNPSVGVGGVSSGNGSALTPQVGDSAISSSNSSTGSLNSNIGSTGLVINASGAGSLQSGPSAISVTAGGPSSSTVVSGPNLSSNPVVSGANLASNLAGVAPSVGLAGSGAAGMVGVHGSISIPDPKQASLMDSGGLTHPKDMSQMQSYIHTKVQDFVMEETIKGVLNAMEEMSDSPYNMKTMGSVVKALDNPSRARQEILMRSLLINQPNIVKIAVDKLIHDYAPGNISDDQRNAVLSAAKVAMEYGRQFGKLGALSFMTRDLSELSFKETQAVDAQGKVVSKAEQDVGLSLTEVDSQTCMVDPQILAKLPAGCNIYTVNFYGQDGVNNFYKVNINGQMVSASNKSLKVPGVVKWSITYGCTRPVGASATPSTPTAAGAQATQTPVVNSMTMVNNVATVGGFNCDSQKGLLLPSGNGIANFTNNNGVLSVS